MLMQKNGDYVILEERLRPETPVFLAAHYISRNTGLGQVPPTVQFSERDMLIMEGRMSGEIMQQSSRPKR